MPPTISVSSAVFFSYCLHAYVHTLYDDTSRPWHMAAVWVISLCLLLLLLLLLCCVAIRFCFCFPFVVAAVWILCVSTSIAAETEWTTKTNNNNNIVTVTTCYYCHFFYCCTPIHIHCQNDLRNTLRVYLQIRYRDDVFTISFILPLRPFCILYSNLNHMIVLYYVTTIIIILLQQPNTATVQQRLLIIRSDIWAIIIIVLMHIILWYLKMNFNVFVIISRSNYNQIVIQTV